MASVPYEEALATLQSMFGGLDRDIIIDVLEQNGCQMEPTVDALLILSGAQGASPREGQVGGNSAKLRQSTRRSFSSNDPVRRTSAEAGHRLEGFGSGEPHPKEEYEDALVSGSLKEKVATAPSRTISAGSAAMRKLTEVLADWGLTSRRSSSEYSLAHENEYRTSALDEDRPSASTSYAQTAGQLLDTVQTATANAIGGVSSSFRRASDVKHRQRAGREGQSLLAHDDDFEDGAVLSKQETRKEESRSLNSGWEEDEEEDEGFIKKEH
ncbi:hypothetical protein KFL_003240060 [Klebsormidium nitens]|uniref:CUE domain-containing protein n=1 Tax=Klebsormidium nitens TaxID=105231 RepID=A0A1Y1I7P5_KLENI|nr:hypothetical protein KFL_003240060 [Klebsormidium nitens]|eukprot:GAQ86985.1 hypothetical protein KFL_003240060 [Klebsormidium nitens]